MTSPVEQVKVRCPDCGHVFEDWFRASINANLDPELAADADYMRAASTVTCPTCSTTTGVAVAVRLLALAVMNFEAGVDDTREGVEFLRAAIDFGVLDDAETARAYQWIRFAGDPRDVTVREATPDEWRQVFGEKGGDR